MDFRISMEDGQYAALADYLKKGVYPNGFSKGQKYFLQRAAKSYKLEAGNYITLIYSRMKPRLID